MTTSDRQSRSTSRSPFGILPPVLIIAIASMRPLSKLGNTGSDAALGWGERKPKAEVSLQETGNRQPWR
jgi:hypothetical protein